MEYAVIQRSTLKGLMNRVQELIDKEGWKPQGGVAVAAARVCDENAKKNEGDDPREFAALICAEDIRKLKDEE